MIKSVRIMPTYAPQRDEAVKPDTQRKLKKPPQYKVLLHNDNYTTMDFVIFVLVDVLHHSEISEIRIMLQVHNQGIGVADVYTREIEENKITKVTQRARDVEYMVIGTK